MHLYAISRAFLRLLPTLSAKITDFIDNLGNKAKKYLVSALLSALIVSLGIVVSCSPTGRSSVSKKLRKPIFDHTEQAVTPPSPATDTTELTSGKADATTAIPIIPDVPAIDISDLPETLPDSLPAGALDSPSGALNNLPAWMLDSLSGMLDSLGGADSLLARIPAALRHIILDSLGGVSADSVRTLLANMGGTFPVGTQIKTGNLDIIAEPDTSATSKARKAFLDAPVFGKNRDSLIYDVKNKLIFVYGQGDLTYEDNNLKADYMVLNTSTKEIYGTGVADTAGVMSRPEFKQAGSDYTMDTITYNLTSSKAKIKGVSTKDGEGYLLGRDLKKMDDNTINLAGGKYTTCDHIEHPHFYIAMTKAKVIPGKKIITGPAYFVMEDVPIYFLGIPGGFFPVSSGPSSGFIMPTYGEETRRGFYLRDGGYYFTFGDYADLSLTGGIYTLGSWEASAKSNYVKRYTYSGNLSANYARTIYGEKGGSDYQNVGNFKLAWSHRQDPKWRPNSQFSASVNFSTSGYNKQGTTNLNDMLNTQTNSSISYSKSWNAGGVPINLSASFNHSQNSRDSTISLTLPNISFSVGTFSPFKRKNATGKERWYEKIQVSYAMQASNTIGPVKEYELFTAKTLEDMKNGVSHKIPVKMSFNLFNYITFTPSFNYNETWNFKRERKEYDPVLNKVVDLDPEFGFFRMYNYNVNGSFSTKLYGMFQVKEKPGKNRWFKAIRHVVSPTVGFTFAPDFSNPKYGFTEYYQTDSIGGYASNGSSSGSRSASINFSLSNQLEMKVASKTDSSGVKKIKLIEQLSASGSYNFLQPGDSLNLSNINLSFRTNIWKNFGINLNATWDPYKVVSVNDKPVRIGKLNIGGGKFGRIVSTGWSFGYTFNPSSSSQPVSNDINSGGYIGAYTNPFDMEYQMDPAERRRQMVSSYYDFSIPWNFGFNYSVSYNNDGLRKKVTQTLGFNGSVTLTGKWGISFNGGFDLEKLRITPGTISLNRDLHCWDMSFQWVPMGTMKSWQFHIGIKSSMLADLKYDKQSSRFDNLME
jgi:lipopolysaccharide assembly outer membrane protein LptD (OstA)